LNRPLTRALLALAAVVAAVALAGCDPDSIAPTDRSQAPISEKTLADIDAKNMDKDSPILVRIFKEEAEMEIWKKNRLGEFALLKTYPICRWSGDLGPKVKEGDRQAPEGFYTITPGQMNPNSNYYLAFNTGYPNAFDRAWNRTGSELMVHGDCSSRGCYAMTDEQMREIYALARESFFGGQKSFQLEAFPFRMTAMNMAKHRNNPNFAFWKMIKEGYDHFEATHQEPKVAVCEKRYVFDATPPANSSRPLTFNARGKCPAFQLDPAIASAVNDHRRQELYQMAQYIARDVSVVPLRSGIDGGMNPVFETQITTQEAYDGNGRLVRIAKAPGALPRETRRLATTIVLPQPVAAPTEHTVVMASTHMPDTAPVILHGNNTKMAAKPYRGARVRIASAPIVPYPKARESAAHKKTNAMAKNMPGPAPAQPVQQARHQQKTSAPAAELRSAFSELALSNVNLLMGAPPIVRANSFKNRWAAIR
jgi:murein L,D-transpeptidase YafK